ncbi:MAG: DUF2065 family protein [Rhodoferax sp.]|nr:DUF2065 family protein [Rhodoferax sp.]
MNTDTLWMALALMLVLEGLLPFISPAAWRNMFSQLLAMRDGQIRFFGLGSILVGLLVIWWLLP